MTGIAFILFPLNQNLWFLGIVSFFGSIGTGSIEVLQQYCFLLVSGTRARTNMTISYVLYGMGLTIGPILIALFGIKSFYITGIC